MSISITINRVGPVNYVKVSNGEESINIAVDSIVPLNEEDIWLGILGMWDIPAFEVYKAYAPEGENHKRKYRDIAEQAAFIDGFIGKEYLEMVAGELGWYNGITQDR